MGGVRMHVALTLHLHQRKTRTRDTYHLGAEKGKVKLASADGCSTAPRLVWLV
jgi:hypothetical protein